MVDKSLVNKIYTTGRDILDLEIFKNGYKQVHHKNTNVSNHCIRVCYISLSICKKFSLRVDEERLIRGALFHDIGIIGRYSKYKNDFICCFKHPIDSYKIYVRNFGEDKIIKDIVTHHMFPLVFIPMHTKEAFIVSVADKLAHFQEFFRK